MFGLTPDKPTLTLGDDYCRLSVRQDYLLCDGGAMGGILDWGFEMVSSPLSFPHPELPVSWDIEIENKHFAGMGLFTRAFPREVCSHCGHVEISYSIQGTGELIELD